MSNLNIFAIFLFIFNGNNYIQGLSMDEVALSNGKTHLRLQNDKSAVLECRYILEDGESVKEITWYHDNFMALKWAPPEPAHIGKGLNEGDAVLSRKDGNLEFQNIRLGLAGKYRCEVTTSDEKTYKSFDYQILIVDMPDVPDSVIHSIKNCKINFSWNAPAINPRPEVTCGVWNTEHGYILKAVSWLAIPYNNGSVAYSLEGEEFQISHMPLDAVIRCEIMKTKIDNSKVQLLEKKYNFTEVWERGCHPLEAGEGVELTYDNKRITCHAEIKPIDDAAPVTAHAKCKNDYTPKYSDFVTSVDLVCKGQKWNVGAGLTWNHFDNLICEKLSEVSKALPPKPPSSSLRNIENDETSSGSSTFMNSWSLAFILISALLSGLLWGIKNQTKKKDPRFTA